MTLNAIDFINGGPLRQVTEDADAGLVDDLPDSMPGLGISDGNGDVYIIAGGCGPLLMVVRGLPISHARAIGEQMRYARDARTSPEALAKQVKAIARDARRKWGKP